MKVTRLPWLGPKHSAPCQASGFKTVPQPERSSSPTCVSPRRAVIAVTSSYVMNARFTFTDSERPLSFADYLKFAATQIGGFLAHTATILIAAPFIPLILAKPLGIGVGFLVNFALARGVVFRPAGN